MYISVLVSLNLNNYTYICIGVVALHNIIQTTAPMYLYNCRISLPVVLLVVVSDSGACRKYTSLLYTRPSPPYMTCDCALIVNTIFTAGQSRFDKWSEMSIA
jgi:hypothetical protein